MMREKKKKKGDGVCSPHLSPSSSSIDFAPPFDLLPFVS